MLFRVLLGVVLAGVLWATHQTHMKLVQLLPLKQEINAQTLVLPPAFSQLLALGHESLAADLLWLQLIQYYGAVFQQDLPPEHLEAMFDTVTQLDPDFEDAYLFASYLLSDSREQQEAALRILEKGARRMPENWRMPFQIGFVYYLHLDQPLKAASYFEAASRKPGAPDLPARLAAQLYKRTQNQESCELGYRLWLDAFERAPNEELKVRAGRHLAETRMACDLIGLRKAISRFSTLRRQRFEQSVKQAKADNKPVPKAPSFLPPSLAALKQAGLLKEIPQDPLKRAYVYQAKTGQIRAQSLPWKAIDLKPSDLMPASPPEN
ncbi:MAG: tetratricopeptide repeat protein [Candidatus Sericytochromatia bacterium]